MTATPPQDRVVAEALAEGDRCWLATRGIRWPHVTPTVFWSDGAGIWMTAAAGSPEVAALRRHPDCALWIPAPDRRPNGFGAVPRDAQRARGAVMHGRARVFGPGDPVGLTFHGATISAAMAALAVKQAGALLGFAQDAARAVPRLALRRQVVVRVLIDEARAAARPATASGVAPALPVVVPADVRRALAGERRVVVATDGPAELTMAPALWASGFALEPPPDEPGGPAAAAVDTPPRRRPTEAVNLVLSGTLSAGGALEPAEATWWRGFEAASATVPAVAGVTLPD